MITFKHTSDINKLSSTHQAHFVIKELIDFLITAYDSSDRPYRPEDEGYIVLIEEGDTECILTEIWGNWTMLDIPWEGVMQEDGFFNGIFLANNKFGIVFVIPDAKWINGELRETLLYHLDP